mgnify:CR=1 FL=1
MSMRAKKVQSAQEVLRQAPSTGQHTTLVSNEEFKHYSHYPIKAYRPYLDKEAKSLILISYREREYKYNEFVEAENKKNNAHNAKVDLLWKESDEGERYEQENKNLYEQYRKPLKKGKEKKARNVHDYNALAKKYNEEKGLPIIKYVKIQPLKEQQRNLTDAILRLYELRLHELDRTRQKSNSTDKLITIPKIELNSLILRAMTHKNGRKMLLKKKQAILDGIHRLVEAGVLQYRSFRGSHRGVLYFINPEIMHVFDNKTQKIVSLDNQLVTSEGSRKAYDKTPYRTTISEKNIKDDVRNLTSSKRKKIAKESEHPISESDDFLSGEIYPTDNYQNEMLRSPSGKDEKTKMAGRENSAENVNGKSTKRNYALENSNDLRDLIEEERIFADKIHQWQYATAPPIATQTLKFEVDSGYLPKHEFRKLLIQETIKHLAKIYLNHEYYKALYPLVVLKVLQTWKKSGVFMHRNGAELSKAKMFQQYRELLFCIFDEDWGAAPRAKRGSFKPFDPNDYLNPFDSSPGTFMFHFKNVRKKNVVIEKLKKETVLLAKKRGQKSIDNSRAIKRLYKYMARKMGHGTFDLSEITDYSRNNMPRDVHRNLAHHIGTFRSNLFKYAS